MQQEYVITIKAIDRPGLLHLITGQLNRKLIPVRALNAVPFVDGEVLITLTILASERALSPLLFKLENIIEVISIHAAPFNDALIWQSVLVKLNPEVMNSAGREILKESFVEILSAMPGYVLIAAYGSPIKLKLVVKKLSPYVSGISFSAALTDSPIMDKEDRISRLAA